MSTTPDYEMMAGVLRVLISEFAEEVDRLNSQLISSHDTEMRLRDRIGKLQNQVSELTIQKEGGKP